MKPPEMRLLWVSTRAACVLLEDGGLYEMAGEWALSINGNELTASRAAVRYLPDLLPDTAYVLEAQKGDARVSLSFHTKKETYTLDARDFGAKGDGVHDDTPALQAAIASCPPGGRVLVPPGRYLTSPLFLKSGLRLEITRGATLALHADMDKSPILPGLLQSWDEESEFNAGSWEGNPLPIRASLLTGIGVTDVEIYGGGALDGQGLAGGWWGEPKRKTGGAYRGRLIFLNRCEGVTIAGLHLMDSPSWNVHPYFSNDISLFALDVSAPPDSPNTDGINPESSRDVRISGCRFSVGDDCVAIKSGKIYMGSKYKTPCERVTVSHCLMEAGHGGVTIGSEMAGGVRDVRIVGCLMCGADRALRVKTRRGRGARGRIDTIRMENVALEGVGAPLVVNCFYHCDPDGHAPWAQDRARRPKDDTTPSVGSITLTDVTATACRWAAAYLLGLPESPIESVRLTRCSFTFGPQAVPGIPAMADGVLPCAQRGIIAQNVGELALEDVLFEGIDGDGIETDGVIKLNRADASPPC